MRCVLVIFFFFYDYEKLLICFLFNLIYWTLFDWWIDFIKNKVYEKKPLLFDFKQACKVDPLNLAVQYLCH